MAVDFRSAVDAGGVRVTAVEGRLLRGARILPRAEWATLPRLRPAVRALEALVVAGRADATDTEVVLPAAEAVALSPEIADLINLPPLAAVSLRLGFEGRVESPGGAIRLRWSDRDYREIRPERTGLLLAWGVERARLSASLFRLVEAVDAYNATQGRPLEERVATWLPVQESLRETLGAEVSADGYAASLTIYQAGSFALDVRETPRGVDFEPVLMARAKAASLDDDAPAEEIGDEAGPPPASGLRDAVTEALLSAEDHARFLGALAGPGGARDAYVVGRNRYVLIDPHLKRALDVVKEKRSASAQERRQFVRNPRSALTEAFDASADEGLATALFVETEQYSGRVLELGVWERPALPWISKRSHSWVPEGGWVDAAGVPAPPPQLTPEARESLAQQIAEAKEAGAQEVRVGDVPVPIAEAERLLAAVEVASSTEPASREASGEEGRAETSSEKQVLLIKTNHEQLEFEQQLVPRTALIGLAPPADRMGATRFKPHQTTGFDWLLSAWRAGWPGVLLADDMGLGKTFQALSFLAWIKSNQAAARSAGDGKVVRGPILVVAPTALLKNWEKECDQHLSGTGLGERVDAYGPGLSRLKQPPERRRDPGETLDVARLREADWILTTYETLTGHEQAFARIRYAVVLFDEMQKVKAPDTLNTKAAKTLNADFVLGLTGTPIENRLEDLWCLFDRLAPGYLGDLKSFSAQYKEAASDRLVALKRKLDRPVNGTPSVMLRRMKEQVLEGLPEKKEERHSVEMPRAQAEAYGRIIAAARGGNQEPRDRNLMLKVIHDLRGISLHPDDPAAVRSRSAAEFEAFAQRSARLAKTVEILREIDRRGDKAIIFIENLAMQDAVADGLAALFDLPRRPAIINGGTPGGQRQRIVDDFQARPPGFDLLVLSPKAAGVGLTITAASHVIHLSRWWNPAVEDQCNDRVYRIGQNKPVTIHLPMAIFPVHPEASFDRTLDGLLASKRALSREMLAPPVSEADTETMFAKTVGMFP
jgi:superfamily II DNA or RNA helicase